MKAGALIISLDFELYWGVRDTRSLESYRQNILGVREAIPAMLDLFDKYDVKATFATVGFLFCSGKEELTRMLPADFPSYHNIALSPYTGYFDSVGINETEDPFHFGLSLIRMIMAKEKHEIATHTFSHYYCLEKGQTLLQFRDDLRAAKKAAVAAGVEFKSIVFPRNQYSNDYLTVCKEEGLVAFRGTENAWLYASRNREDETFLRRGFRLVDSYVNLSGYHAGYPVIVNGLCNVPSSRFLRPYSKPLAWLDRLRLHRIKKQISVAAERNMLFHLWWHPHNFGTNLKENLLFLEKVFIHYKSVQQLTGFNSMTMAEAAAGFYKSQLK